jgi:hypothetical protein
MARAALGVGVRDLADLAKVSTNTVTRLETGNFLKARTVEAIQRALEAAGVQFTNGKRPGVSVPWNFVCRACGAKYFVTRIEEPFRPGERATCQHCTHNLPPRDGKHMIKYQLIRRPDLNIDPEEIVMLAGRGLMTVRSAVREVMRHPPEERILVSIFRGGEPSILGISEIEKLFRLPEFSELGSADQ